MSIFFKGLNERMELTALAVVFHIELYKNREHIARLFGSPGFPSAKELEDEKFIVVASGKKVAP